MSSNNAIQISTCKEFKDSRIREIIRYIAGKSLIIWCWLGCYTLVHLNQRYWKVLHLHGLELLLCVSCLTIRGIYWVRSIKGYYHNSIRSLIVYHTRTINYFIMIWQTTIWHLATLKHDIYKTSFSRILSTYFLSSWLIIVMTWNMWILCNTNYYLQF